MWHNIIKALYDRLKKLRDVDFKQYDHFKVAFPENKLIHVLTCAHNFFFFFA